MQTDTPFTKPATKNPIVAWTLPRRDTGYIVIRMRRSTLIAACISILLHLAILFFVVKHELDVGESKTSKDSTLVVDLAPPQAPAPAAASSPPPPSVETPQNTIPVPVPKPRKAKKAKQVPVITAPKSPERAPEPPVTAQRPTPPSPDADAPTDMMSYVAAARRRRDAAESYAAQENAAAIAKENGPSEEEKRDAIIKRNLQNPGTNGVFQILNKTVRTAQFSFRGWREDRSNSTQETISVDAGLEGDINRAIIRKMIEVIRRYYKGDFQWESRRLDRVITLSARPEDSAGLEDFLMQEFFNGAEYRGQ